MCYVFPMRKFVLILALLAWIPVCWQPLWGQAPSVGEKAGGNKKGNPTLSTDNPKPLQIGTKETPLVVDPQGHVNTPEETAKSQKDEDHKAFVDFWAVSSAVAVAVFTGILMIIGWRGVNAANRTLREIKRQADLMDTQIQDSRKSGADNSRDVQASIAEATRAAKAMEGIAESMVANAESMKTSVAISREIADTQKLVTELQSRAYLAVFFTGVIPQNTNPGYKYEPRAKIVNRGNTPAHDIRFSMNADIVDFPVKEDFFAFPVPQVLAGYSSMIAPGLEKIIRAVVPNLCSESESAEIRSATTKRIIAWGMVSYKDVFGIERSTRFGFTCLGVGKPGEDNFMSEDTSRNNDAT